MEGDESMQTLKELVGRLPPDLQQEVRDFVEFLLERYGKKPKGKSRFKWASVLYAVAERYELTILSFDADFDRTERGRKTPSQL